MKMQRVCAVAGLIVFGTCLGSLNLWAHPPQPRRLCGVVHEINPAKRTLTVQSSERAAPVTLVWTRITEFVKNQEPAESRLLKAGLRVCVEYRSPFFGKPSITKVVWATDEMDRPRRRSFHGPTQEFAVARQAFAQQTNQIPVKGQGEIRVFTVHPLQRF